MIAGSPETVRQRMEELIKGLHVGNIFCLMHVGNMPADKCMYSTKLFAEKVMPKLRNMFPEYADDDRFWCKPIAKRVTPGALPAERRTARRRGALENRMELKTVQTNTSRCATSKAAPGEPLVFLHGAGGLRLDPGFLDALAESIPRLCAASCRATARARNARELRDMLDFTLHTWDVVERWA